MTWEHFKDHYLHLDSLDFALDYSRIQFEDDFFERHEDSMQDAFQAMRALESGSIANPEKILTGRTLLVA